MIIIQRKLFQVKTQCCLILANRLICIAHRGFAPLSDGGLAALHHLGNFSDFFPVVTFMPEKSRSTPSWSWMYEALSDHRDEFEWRFYISLYKGYTWVKIDTIDTAVKSRVTRRHTRLKGNIPRISSYTWLFAKNTGLFVVLRSNP